MEVIASIIVIVLILWLLGPGDQISKRKTEAFYLRHPEYRPEAIDRLLDERERKREQL